MIDRWPTPRRTAIISVPGDRPNWLIAEAGRAAARWFERIIIKEDQDRRGRPVGEAAAILRDAIVAKVPTCDCQHIPDEGVALAHALESMQPSELIVVFYDLLSCVQGVLERYGATPQTGMPELMPARRPQHHSAQAH